METCRKSFGKQQYSFDLKEEEQPLLHYCNDHHMAQSFDSPDRAEKVVVRIDKENSGNRATENASNSSSTETPEPKLLGFSKKIKFSFEDILTEAVRRRNKDLPSQDHIQRSLNWEEVVPKNSWRSLMNKTKSRLLDPPEEQLCERSYHGQNSGEVIGKKNVHREDDIDDIPEEYRKMKFSVLTMFQWVSLAIILLALFCSLSIPILKRQELWDLPIWKWEIMVLALICGHLVSGWGIRFLVIFIEHNFLLRKRVLYFVYGLRKAVQNCLWLGLVLLVWHFIFDSKVQVETKSKVLPHVTKVLVCFLAGTLIWLLKTLLVKVLASLFHVNTFFERIKESLFNQYVIETLSGPPFIERCQSTVEEGNSAAAEIQVSSAGGNVHRHLMSAAILSRRKQMENGKLQRTPTIGKTSRGTNKRQDEEIQIDHLGKLSQKNISAWNMRRMINIIRQGHLCTLDEKILNSDMEDESLQIKSEYQAKEAAKKIFNNVAQSGSPYIYLEDVMFFMDKEEAEKAMNLFGANCENEGVSKSALNDWVVNAFKERKTLALSLNDTKTAVDELHIMLNILVAIVVAIIWLIIIGIPIGHFLVFISSQLLLVAFIFGNTCKTVFEAIIFLFIMHPFDVGDGCEVDGVQMTVEEMNILTTVFLRYDNQKIIYPNSVLSSKPIGNFYRSPDMREGIDFSIHISTPMERIAIMKDKIIGYIKRTKEHWHPTASLTVREVEDMNKVKFSLWVTHRLNYQNMGERWARRAVLMEEMISIFKELNIDYRMLPLDVHLRNMPPLTSN